MKKPIRDEVFWKQRLMSALDRGQPHRAVYEITADKMEEINAAHKGVFHKYIKPGDFVLDAGCGFGRILPLLPSPIKYHGVDLSPDFIKYAREQFPERGDRKFFNDDLLPFLQGVESKAYTVGIGISMKRMVETNIGKEAWTKIEQHLRRTCVTVLLLEYSTEETDWEIIRD